MKDHVEKFSVVMPVFNGDDLDFFKQAIDSILNQTKKPNEIIVVIDGPVNEELEQEIKDLSQHESISTLYLDENQGVGVARREAIKRTKNDIIALMDADDISLGSRFEKQLKIISSNHADVVGGWIEEFDESIHDLDKVRKLPIEHEDIYRFGKWRMPVNNVTLMFTKEAYEKAGGYSSKRKCEDWDLVTRMLVNGSIFYNIPEVLVNVRAGEKMVKRRRSFTHFISELMVFPMMYRNGYINLMHLIINMSGRLILRIMPRGLTSYLYSIALRQSK